MSILEIMQLLSNLTTLLGIPIALYVFIDEKRKERKDREYRTYDALGMEYREYLKLCMENPHLNLYDVPLDEKRKLGASQKIQQLAMFDILVSLLERAFLMYRDQSNRIKRNQWQGWAKYMEDYAKLATFRKLWKERGEEYDHDFIEYMSKLVISREKKH